MAEAVSRRLPICLDSSALLAYLQRDERHNRLVAQLLEHPHVPVVISTITLSEVLVRPARSGDELRVRRVQAGLARLPLLLIVPFGEDHAHQAAIVRAATNLKLPDAGIVATGLLASAIAIVGNDARWRTKPLGLPYLHLGDFAGSG
jgi:PIN domain nuclease of toxin-antitoxin system